MAAASDVSIRLVRPDDAETLSRLEIENRDYVLTGGPIRSDEYVSVAGQRTLIGTLLEGHVAGTCAPFVIEVDGDVVGRIMLNAIVRGPFQSASVGYWIAESAAGRGVVSRALGLLIVHAFRELGLHRLEAGTTLTNDASAHILTKAGFQQYGVAADYLRIGGRWQDHRMFQVLNDEWTEPAEVARSAEDEAQVNTR
jgi:ribosomal-protein-alanine N-acetyltransferase